MSHDVASPEVGNLLECSWPDQESSRLFEQLGSVYGTTRNDLELKPSTQVHQASPSPPEIEQGQLHDGCQFSIPALSSAEQWDLEGFFQLIYSLSAVSFPPSDPKLWNTYSPLIVEAFFEAADDGDHLFTDNELAIAFQKCSEAFARFYGWPKHIRAEVFTHHTSGRDALEGILQLVKLTKGFGIEGEDWWELRRNLRIAFAEPFQLRGWVSEGSDIFQKFFAKSLKIIVDLGVKPGTWTYGIVSDLTAWRKMKEKQEAVATERAMLALRKQSVESAWETLRKAVNGNTSNSPSALSPQNIPHLGPNIGKDIVSKMSPGTYLREHERIKPLLDLQQRLAPSPPHPPLRISPSRMPLTPTPDPGRTYPCDNPSPSPMKVGSVSSEQPDCTLGTPTNPDSLSNTLPSQYIISPEEKSQPEFGDLPDLDFGDPMDMDPWNWNGGCGVSLSPDGLDEGLESQLAATTESNRESHDEIANRALWWSGKQLWEMTDEEFQQFCSGAILQQ